MRRAATLALAAAALAAACGGGSPPSSSSTPTAPPAAATTTAAYVNTTPSAYGPAAPTGGPVGDIRCRGGEVLENHIHTGLAIVLSGQRVTIPTYIGIFPEAGCLYYLHTHADRGVIHLEAPISIRIYTLGDFFRIWGYPLGKDRLLEQTGTVHAWVQGKPFAGNPAAIELRDLETIVLSDAPIAGELPAVDFSEIQP